MLRSRFIIVIQRRILVSGIHGTVSMWRLSTHNVTSALRSFTVWPLSGILATSPRKCDHNRRKSATVPAFPGFGALTINPMASDAEGNDWREWAWECEAMKCFSRSESATSISKVSKITMYNTAMLDLYSRANGTATIQALIRSGSLGFGHCRTGA